MEEHRSPSHTNPAVNASGSAKERSSGPAFGGVDIGESEGGYFLRVAMPGAMRDEGSFSISKDGTVDIQGVIRYEIPSQVPKMKVQQLYPPGPFALSLKLPGRVDPRMFTCKLRYDGIFEVVVMKPGYSDTPAQPSYRERSMPVNT
ncbi:hypothetical protein AAG906_030106 [Vitis piasezkii]|uniref:Increased DNA methylation 3 n=1 Tax=Vitis vinifera TaxID=29760 RepID=A0A438K3C0_VITVI|nr:Increased DNA methylation 3 [Vitis vinifera]